MNLKDWNLVIILVKDTSGAEAGTSAEAEKW